MTLDEIRARVSAFEALESAMTGVEKRKREELAALELQVIEVKRQINESLFINTPEYQELKELKTALKWIEGVGGQDGL